MLAIGQKCLHPCMEGFRGKKSKIPKKHVEIRLRKKKAEKKGWLLKTNIQRLKFHAVFQKKKHKTNPMLAIAWTKMQGGLGEKKHKIPKKKSGTHIHTCMNHRNPFFKGRRPVRGGSGHHLHQSGAQKQGETVEPAVFSSL